MAQIVTMPEHLPGYAEKRVFPFDETLEQVRQLQAMAVRGLPSNHEIRRLIAKLLEELTGLFESAGETLADLRDSADEGRNAQAAMDGMMEMLMDWERGIVDWSEIEDFIATVKARHE